MNRISTISMVDEAHDSFTTLGHHQGRTGGDSIVSNQAGLAKVGIHLLLKWLDVDLIVVNWWVAKRPNPFVRLIADIFDQRWAHFNGDVTGATGISNW